MTTQALDKLDINEVIQNVESSPQPQRVQKALQSIAHQMQQSSNPNTQQWGAQLLTGSPQISKACQQQQG